MIALIGIPSEPPIARIHRSLLDLGADCLFLNQRTFATWDLELGVDVQGLTGHLLYERQTIPLHRVTAIYARPMDFHELPELRREPESSPLRQRCVLLHDLILRWMELAPGRVLNRPSAMASNGSKPYQAQLIRDLGFHIPPTLVTDDPEAVLAFEREHGALIYKSISGARSIVHQLEPADHAHFDRLRACPVQFQARLAGFDVRVHVVGSNVFAVRATSGAVDYRYACRQGETLEMEPMSLDDELRQRCVALARGLGLDFAGIDLKFEPSGRVSCFEVNPCPAYSFYEEHTGQPIAAAVARYLAESTTAADVPADPVAPFRSGTDCLVPPLPSPANPFATVSTA